jgi:hypothetical protein
MRYFPRLPPLLRVVSILNLLFILASLVLFLGSVNTVFPSFPRWPVDASRAVGIAWNLIMLSLACSFVVSNYSLRFFRPGRGAYPLESWQSQVRWLLALAALPLGALALAVFLPQIPLLNFVVVWPNLLAILVLGAVLIYAADKWRA